MPRFPRAIAIGFPHHVTQRGTDRACVFFTNSDRQVYLDLLRTSALQTNLRILAYCLMPNHIHLVAVPDEPDSLSVALRRTHGRYANYLNARRGRTGHLWQNRFYSCALDGAHLPVALRYVERNPVRARLTERVEQYPWSSAAAHFTGHDPREILDMAFWRERGSAEQMAVPSRDTRGTPRDPVAPARDVHRPAGWGFWLYRTTGGATTEDTPSAPRRSCSRGSRLAESGIRPSGGHLGP